MRIVVDTNVVMSGVFFGGAPGRVVEAVARGEVEAFATSAILDEYAATRRELEARGVGRFDGSGLARFDMMVNVIDPVSQVRVSRDPDDDKFLSCAIDARCVYVVSGDKDLLVLGSFHGVEIVTARQFCDRHLPGANL